MIYKDEPSSFASLIKQSFQAYPIIVNKTWYLIIAMFVCFLIPVLMMLYANVYVGLALLILATLLVAFISSIALHMSDAALADNPVDFDISINAIKKRYLSILGGLVLWAVILAIVVLVLIGIISLVSWFNLHNLWHLLGVIVILLIELCFYFAIPLVILEKHTVFRSFEKSIKLFFSNPWRIIALVILIDILITVINFLLILLPWHEIKILYVFYIFLAQTIVYPLLFGVILVLLHDSQLRLNKELS